MHLQDFIVHGLAVLSTVLTIISGILGAKWLSNTRARAILTAVAAAEHLVDSLAFKDNQLDEQRVAIAVMILQRLYPKINTDDAKADIEKFLNIIHDHAGVVPPSVVAATAPVVVAPPKKK